VQAWSQTPSEVIVSPDIDGRATDIDEAIVSVVLAANRLLAALSATAPNNVEGGAVLTTKSINRYFNSHNREQLVERAAMARLRNRIATLDRASVALAAASPRGGSALGALNGRGATSGSHRG